MRTWNIGGTAVIFSAILTLGISSAAHAVTQHSTVRHPAADSRPAAVRSTALHGGSVALRGGTARTAALNGGPARMARGAIHDIAFRTDAGHSRLKRPFGKTDKAIYGSARVGGWMSCVPYVRSVTDIDIKGNATNWWQLAAGVYDRGETPEAGSVMNFRSTGRMRLGHVAVVAAVLNPRMVEIDHANWGGPGSNGGGISRGIPVIDVSENNDWSAVRVGLGRGGDFGSVYPTYGFIYDRPASGRGMMTARAGRSPVTNDEVAEAPAARTPYIDAAAHSLR